MTVEYELQGHVAVLTLGRLEGGEHLLGDGEQHLGVDLGLTRLASRLVLGLDGLSDRGHAALQQLLGHGALLRRQCVECGRAVGVAGAELAGLGLLLRCRALALRTRRLVPAPVGTCALFSGRTIGAVARRPIAAVARRTAGALRSVASRRALAVSARSASVAAAIALACELTGHADRCGAT